MPEDQPTSFTRLLALEGRINPQRLSDPDLQKHRAFLQRKHAKIQRRQDQRPTPQGSANLDAAAAEIDNIEHIIAQRRDLDRR